MVKLLTILILLLATIATATIYFKAENLEIDTTLEWSTLEDEKVFKNWREDTKTQQELWDEWCGENPVKCDKL